VRWKVLTPLMFYVFLVLAVRIVGRRPGSGIAGLMLADICYPFAQGSIGLKGLGICFTVIFFVASSAASAAYSPWAKFPA
jgi:hypothetical protein